MESKQVKSSESSISQLDSSGALTLNLTISASDLTLGNKLGQGAYGTVYKAKWRNKDVAVKQLLLPNPSEQEKNEFKQEAAVMFQIAADSDHVVRLYKITMQPQLSLVMELMPNGSLYELLQNNRDKPLDWGIRYRLAMDISTGLEDIHSHGVLHRDLKSLNVLLDGNLRAKLTDFGLATTKLTSSRHSSVQGTPHWMAPEVANGDADSQGSDVYSLGMVLFELAAHRHPYPNLKPMQVLLQVSQGKQETIPADCPVTFKQLILDCWTVAEKRPKAADITTRLRPMLDSKDTPTIPTAGGVLDSLTSTQLKGSADYQIGAAPAAPHRSAVLQQTPASLVNIVSPSASHSQPQSPTPSTPVEEKAPGLTSPTTSRDLFAGPKPTEIPPATSQTTSGSRPLEDKAFQTGYALYNQGQRQEALPYFQQATKENYPPAYLYLGRMYEAGLGAGKDLREAAIWYNKAQAQEAWFIKQAASGRAEEQFYLGRYYDHAAGAKKDPVKAFGWYRRAADQGNAAAQYCVGLCYDNGEGVKKDDDQAITWYRRAADQGNAGAQFNLGWCYSNGQGVTKDHNQAAIWYHYAARQGHTEAQCSLGDCYANGIGASKDLTQAKQWYEKAAAQGNVRAKAQLSALQRSSAPPPVVDEDENALGHLLKGEEKIAGPEAFQKGEQLYWKGQYQKALPYLQQAAKEGYPPAYLYLGRIYETGLGVGKDPGESAIWYDKAQAQEAWFKKQADSGRAADQFYLGRYYDHAAGAKKDPATAVVWYRRAAEQGDAGAQYNLGRCYALGRGVTQKDPATAVVWYRRAAEQGHAGAQLLLGRCYGHGRGVKQDDQEAVSWFRRAADQGNTGAQLLLGVCYADGRGVKQDDQEAVSWFRRAADQGNTGAQFLLGACYADGRGVKQDDKEAVSWLRRAADQGNAGAQYALGSCYADGQGVKQDDQEAVNWFRKAAEQGHADAQFELGVGYEYGQKSISKDLNQAKQWYEKAAAQGNENAKTNLSCLLQANPSLANNHSSFFASSAAKPDVKLDAKMEVKQTIPNLPAVTPKLMPEKSTTSVVVDEKALGQLLKCVAEGEQAQAEALVKKDSKLLLAAGKVTDLSDRTFDNITAFQYALWAMDYHMWTMIQKYLPTEAQAKQHALLESKGTVHGKHFDLQPLLGALKTYVDNYLPWSAEQCREHWSKKVGGAQKLLPAHVVNEYCRPDRPFDPCPTEWTATLPRTRAVEVYINSKWVEGTWFLPPTPSEALGSSFAFWGSWRPGVRGVCRPGFTDGDWACDLKSLQALWNARTQQLQMLADTLVVGSQSAMQVGLK